jgi:predicted metalloprotease with PDZ domain
MDLAMDWRKVASGAGLSRHSHRREPAAAPEAFDASGMYLLSVGADRRRFEVHDLVPHGPAARAGVERGDVIRSLDGRPASELTLALRTQLRLRMSPRSCLSCGVT